MKNNDRKVITEEQLYYYPMPLNDERIRDFNLAPEIIQWKKIGSRKVKVAMIPVNEKQYRELMRELWKEEKRRQRSREVSLDELLEDRNTDIASEGSFEETVEKKDKVAVIYEFIEALDETNQMIMKMMIDGETEQAISKRVGLCQKTVNNRKHKLQERLRRELDKY